MKKSISILAMIAGILLGAWVFSGKAHAMTKYQEFEMECRLNALMAKEMYEKTGRSAYYLLPRLSFVYHGCLLSWWEVKKDPITADDYQMVDLYFGVKKKP